jgi:hypothetical protein
MTLAVQTLTMSYTHHSNTGTNENERNHLSFSFSEKTRVVTTEELGQKVKISLQSILNNRFDHYEKRTIDPKHGRLNFACPYCGDSYQDSHKKRGNIYTDKGFYFKCYNCGKYRGILGFLRDFKIDVSADEIVLAKELQKNAPAMIRNVDPMVFLDKNNLLNFAIEREEIERKYKLVPLDRSKIYIYLQKRLQPDMTKFSWSEEKQQLYIFHLIPETTKVLGYQIRNFKYQPKYMTWKLSKIYEDFGIEVPDEVYEIDDISTIFGILTLDFSKPVTVFEGPLDSFLFKNSAATCSSNIDFPIELGTLRYMYDYDKAGKTAAMEKIQKGTPVFLWRKLLADTGIQTINKMDLTDFLVYCKRKGIKPPRLGNYFSNNRYDIYDI